MSLDTQKDKVLFVSWLTNIADMAEPLKLKAFCPCASSYNGQVLFWL